MLILRETLSRTKLIDVIAAVRLRWRIKLLLRGLAVVLMGGFVTFLVATFIMDLARFDTGAVVALRVVSWIVVAALGVIYLVRPLVRRVSNEQVALYLEENAPSLQASLLGAVEAERTDAPVSPRLTERMVEQAIQRCREIEFGKHIEQRSVVRSSGALTGLVMAAGLVVFLNPSFLRNAMPFLFPFGNTELVNPYAVRVLPGDTLLARGADQLVSAQLTGFEADVVEISVRRGTGEWERYAMIPGAEPGSFEVYLFDLLEATEYYVEASGVRSPAYRIEVADLPYVQQIDLEYRFPRYTGLQSRVEEDGGDIAALRGTTVLLTIQPTLAVTAGRLLVDGEEPQDLTVDGDGRLTGRVVVGAETYYRIELESIGGRFVPASADYSIYPLDDQPPSISISKPGRDSKVTNVEEAFVEVQAEDDYGLGVVRLIYSVNGGSEDTVQLSAGGRGTKDLTAGHTFYLEEWDLEPGDLVSYYAQARDTRGGSGHTATTDIYFMEVRPFRRDYRQAEQAGMPGGGGGGELDGTLSVQQRQVVSATFKLIRDQDTFAEDDFNENLATMALAQGRIRERVEAIARRLTDRGIIQEDSGFQVVYAELPKAAAEMVSAEERFGERDPRAALPAAQRALQHLQRADAAFRDVQVQRQQAGGGGGGGGSQAAEDLADLFELELDKLRNQYETVQRGEQQQVDEQIDETLQKLRELARRQQQQNERMRQRAQQLQQQGGQAGGGSRGQQQLADEAEELARQLQRLAREQSLPELEQTARNLQRAADAMRQAAARSRAGDPSNGSEALERLREARETLDRNRSARLARDVQDAMRRIEDLQRDQDDMIEAAETLPAQGTERMRALREIREHKDQMAADIADLEARIDRMARESRREQPDATRDLDRAVDAIRDNRLSEKIRYSRGVIASPSRQYATNFEEQIGANLEEIRQHLEDASGNVGESRGQQVARSLERTRELVQGLESMRERMQERAEQNETDGPSTPTGEAQTRQPSGQTGEGQPPGSPGQRGGQPGQPGGRQTGDGGGRPDQAGDRQGGGFNPDAQSAWGGRLTPGDIRQFRSEARQRRGDAEQLRQELERQGIDVDGIDNILSALRELDRSRNYNDPAGIRALQDAVIEGLKEFEYGLRRQLLGDDEAALTLSGNDEVPPGFREMVDEYYKALSRTGTGRGN